MTGRAAKNEWQLSWPESRLSLARQTFSKLRRRRSDRCGKPGEYPIGSIDRRNQCPADHTLNDLLGQRAVFAFQRLNAWQALTPSGCRTFKYLQLLESREESRGRPNLAIQFTKLFQIVVLVNRISKTPSEKDSERAIFSAARRNNNIDEGAFIDTSSEEQTARTKHPRLSCRSLVSDESGQQLWNALLRQFPQYASVLPFHRSEPQCVRQTFLNHELRDELDHRERAIQISCYTSVCAQQSFDVVLSARECRVLVLTFVDASNPATMV